MIRFTASIEGLTLKVTVSGFAIYLDNWAINDLAEGDPDRRKRFLETIDAGAELIFSVSNAAELAGPQGRSADAAKAFLNEIGPRWYPVELDTSEVIKRELNGQKPATSCISARFLQDYTRIQMAQGDTKKIVDPQDLLRLGGVLEWVGPQRDSIRNGSADFDAMLAKKIGERRSKFKRNPSREDRGFPILSFRPDMPASFAFHNLLRTLIVEGQPVKKGDGLDFCHAVMASGFANFAALDKHWKRRIEGLPQPNGLARIYGPWELDQLVTDIESWVNSNQRLAASR